MVACITEFSFGSARGAVNPARRVPSGTRFGRGLSGECKRAFARGPDRQRADLGASGARLDGHDCVAGRARDLAAKDPIAQRHERGHGRDRTILASARMAAIWVPLPRASSARRASSAPAIGTSPSASARAVCASKLVARSRATQRPSTVRASGRASLRATRALSAAACPSSARATNLGMSPASVAAYNRLRTSRSTSPCASPALSASAPYSPFAGRRNAPCRTAGNGSGARGLLRRQWRRVQAKASKRLTERVPFRGGCARPAWVHARLGIRVWRGGPSGRAGPVARRGRG